MSALGTLMRCQWRIWRNGWRRGSQHRAQRLGMVIVLPLFMALLFGGTLRFLRLSGMAELLDLSRLVPGASESLGRLTLEALALSSTATFVILALGSLEQAFESFFLAPDLALLLSSPITRASVFVVKFLANMRWDVAMVLAMSLPIWLAFGVWLRAPVIFYVSLLFGWASLLILVSSAGTLVAMALTRVISAPHLRQFVISFAMGMALLLVVGVQAVVTGILGKDQVMDALGVQWLSRQAWLPSVWLSRALLPIMQRAYVDAVPWAALLGGAAVISLAAAYTLMQRAYREGWSRAQMAESGQHGVARVGHKGRALFHGQVGALLRKDLRLLVRQPVQWYQAILGTVVLVMVTASFGRSERGAPSAYMLSLVMSYVASNTFAMNLALRGISKEGRAWWLVQAAPTSVSRILLAKFLTAFVPTGLYGAMALVAMQRALRLPMGLTALGLPLLLTMSAGMICAHLAVGIRRTDFRRAAETRNADLVAVLTSQVLSYALLSPGLLALSLPPLLEQLEIASPLRVVVILSLGTLAPLSLIYAWLGWRYSAEGLRALCLGEEAPPALAALIRPSRLRRRRSLVKQM